MRTKLPASCIVVGAATALGACTAPETAATAPMREPAPATAAIAARTPSADQCRASERQVWVGQSVHSLPEQPESETWRVVCTTCDRTDDYRPERLNVEFDDATRRIVKVSCG
ncbi:peptidase inhibitor I78 [Brevundimonas sp. PAMC22021]|uniref:peptidase inhibitor I78 n=1 Tax=Brevundimonas sp. PAMC22021 TaxID=2861285 RepID=UPI001C631D34|nr:peptidase inhibitor I78 [Brevundimonas sp. PAMC22021]QYF87024.1 peptidase inhibitor I78 [Brevundimonas sp. PAMC22021]